MNHSNNGLLCGNNNHHWRLINLNLFLTIHIGSQIGRFKLVTLTYGADCQQLNTSPSKSVEK